MKSQNDTHSGHPVKLLVRFGDTARGGGLKNEPGHGHLLGLRPEQFKQSDGDTHLVPGPQADQALLAVLLPSLA